MINFFEKKYRAIKKDELLDQKLTSFKFIWYGCLRRRNGYKRMQKRLVSPLWAIMPWNNQGLSKVYFFLTGERIFLICICVLKIPSVFIRKLFWLFETIENIEENYIKCDKETLLFWISQQLCLWFCIWKTLEVKGRKVQFVTLIASK